MAERMLLSLRDPLLHSYTLLIEYIKASIVSLTGASQCISLECI